MEKKLLDALNAQINEELYSSYLYLSMATDSAIRGYPGFANWFRVQAEEEMFHSMKFYQFVMERGERVVLDAIKAPEVSWETPLASIKAALAHEKHITGRINSLYRIARETFDPATEIFLQWFVTEQVEEEANVSDIVQRLEQAAQVPSILIMLDRELATRPHLYTLPVAN